MTREDRQLLIQDLCARVPYHPKGHVVNSCNGAECDEWLTCETFTMFTNIMNNTRLYLRPMSSMTEEEKVEYTSYCFEQPFLQKGKTPNLGSVPMCIDWLNAHHFDYRGLIQKRLALEAPDGMYNL